MLDPIHPFPARMAPEIAFEFLGELPKVATVLDPMCGSGVALRSALEQGHRSIGFDIDPLAVLMSRVWTEKSPHMRLVEYAYEAIDRASRYKALDVPWQHRSDDEAFIDFWFAPSQKRDLQRLALAIHRTKATIPGYLTRAMQIALSRLIVTKTKGASLAWDVAHSRPHKKKETNDFDVLSEFARSCEILERKLNGNSTKWSCNVRRGDARRLNLPDSSVDAIITSPPYLNAIDYMRGHRLSLVWLGYNLKDLRTIRSESIGSELNPQRRQVQKRRTRTVPDRRTQHLIDQYIFDLGRLTRELKRVARKGAKICIITANSNIRGYEVRTNTLVHAAAAGAGLKLISETIRVIEKSKRYLPIDSKNKALKLRMMEEHIQQFAA